MTTGSSSDIVTRVRKVIPRKWFSWVAPNRDALLGGLGDAAAWCYNWVFYARAQIRLSTAYGVWLDIFAYDFLRRYLVRNGTADDVFRATIRATILQERVTRAGMINALTLLTGKAPKIFEPWSTFDTGAYSGPRIGGPQYGSMGYGVGQGGYGSMQLPAQVFIIPHRGAGMGIPGVGGYGSNVDGYGVGKVEWAGITSELSGITDPMIYNLITMTKPTGVTAWTQIQA
jgi:hypothetical protein